MAYQQIRKKVQEQQAALEEEYAKLEDLQNDLIAKQNECRELESKQGKRDFKYQRRAGADESKACRTAGAAEEAARKQKEKKPQLQQQRRTIIVEVREEL